MRHDYITALNLQGYVENEQFDAQECFSYIVNLFYPWVKDGNDSDNNGYPDDCLFLLDGEETHTATNVTHTQISTLRNLCVKLLFLTQILKVLLNLSFRTLLMIQMERLWTVVSVMHVNIVIQ